jgi:hypothetical protein
MRDAPALSMPGCSRQGAAARRQATNMVLLAQTPNIGTAYA